jgi:hypothetical protein
MQLSSVPSDSLNFEGRGPGAGVMIIHIMAIVVRQA